MNRIILLFLVVLTFVCCGETPDRTMYKVESVKTKEGYTYNLIHDFNCPRYDDWTVKYENKKDYMKRVYDAYCEVCFTEDEVEKMDKISLCNITILEEMSDYDIESKYRENKKNYNYEDEPFDDYIELHKTLDKSFRGYNLYKGFKGDSIVPIYK